MLPNTFLKIYLKYKKNYGITSAGELPGLRLKIYLLAYSFFHSTHTYGQLPCDPFSVLNTGNTEQIKFEMSMEITLGENYHATLVSSFYLRNYHLLQELIDYSPSLIFFNHCNAKNCPKYVKNMLKMLKNRC